MINDNYLIDKEWVDKSLKYELKIPTQVTAVLKDEFYLFISTKDDVSIITGIQDKESFEEQYKQL